MLKIKDEVDLKELEKFGFIKDNYNVIYQYQENKFTGIRVKIETRKIGFYNSIDIVVEKKVTDVLYDLIEADLVEKVSD